MTKAQLPGWTTVGERELSHRCGARIFRHSSNKWTAQTVGGARRCGFSKVELAAKWLDASDPDFWSIGSLGSVGTIAGILIESSSYCRQQDSTLNVWSVPAEIHFPKHHEATFTRLYLGKATCVRCGTTPAVIRLRRQIYVNGAPEFRNIIVCECGFPVWRMSLSDSLSAGDGLLRAERHWRRKASLAIAGGKHSAKEMAEIRVLQQNRCIYCDTIFTETTRPTKDHLVAVVDGGTDWSINIVLACGHCNSHRREIPFEEYCEGLGTSQMRKIAGHLTRRLSAIDLETLPPEAMEAYSEGVIVNFVKSLGKTATLRGIRPSLLSQRGE